MRKKALLLKTVKDEVLSSKVAYEQIGSTESCSTLLRLTKMTQGLGNMVS